MTDPLSSEGQRRAAAGYVTAGPGAADVDRRVTWPKYHVDHMLREIKLALPPDTDAKRMAWAVIEGDDLTAYILADSIQIDRDRLEGVETVNEQNSRLRGTLLDIMKGIYECPSNGAAALLDQINLWAANGLRGRK